jgi:hypothetical protein
MILASAVSGIAEVLTRLRPVKRLRLLYVGERENLTLGCAEIGGAVAFGSDPEHRMLQLRRHCTKEIVSPFIAPQDRHHAIRPKSPNLLTPSRVVVLVVALQLPHDTRLTVLIVPDFRPLDFEEKVVGVLAFLRRIGDGEISIGVHAVLQI